MAEEAVSKGGWNPNQYDRFKAEREQPFDVGFQLAEVLRPRARLDRAQVGRREIEVHAASASPGCASSTSAAATDG